MNLNPRCHKVGHERTDAQLSALEPQGFDDEIGGHLTIHSHKNLPSHSEVIVNVPRVRFVVNS